MCGVTLPYNTIGSVRSRLTQLSPNLGRYGDIEAANFFKQAAELSEVGHIVCVCSMAHVSLMLSITHNSVMLSLRYTSLRYIWYIHSNLFTHMYIYLSYVLYLYLWLQDVAKPSQPIALTSTLKTLSQFYMTNSVSRASRTMAKCVQAAKDSNL